MPTVNSPAPTASDAHDSEYPEQRHAGAVGYGPEYGRDVATGDKFEGFKEEVKGKIRRKPELVEHGKELRTGELKKKQEEHDNVVPSASVDGDQRKAGATDEDVPKNNTNQSTQLPPGAGDTTQTTDKGGYEQAATVAPEGSDVATTQQQGEHPYRNIG